MTTSHKNAFSLVLEVFKMLISFSSSTGLLWTFPPAVSLQRRQHLCAASGLSVAAVGAAGLSHHTLFPLLLVVSLFHRLPVPVSCIASSTLHVSCHLCFAAVSLLGSQNHTSSNELSFRSRSVSCHTRSFSFNPLASVLPMAILHHLYTQDMLSLIDVTHNTMQVWHAISIPWSLSHEQPEYCENTSVIILRDVLKSNKLSNARWLLLWCV